MTTVRCLLVSGLLLAATAATVVGTVLGTASSASALSCVGRERVVAEARLLLTGTVVDTADGELEVAVEEVRRGELPAGAAGTLRLTVEAAEYGPWPLEGGRLADGWRSPRTWLFAPYEEDGEWRANPCTAWPAGGEGRRAGAGWERTGTSGEAGPFDAPVLLAGSAAAVAVVGGAAVWLVRRRRTPTAS